MLPSLMYQPASGWVWLGFGWAPPLMPHQAHLSTMQREDVLQPIETEGRGRLPPEAGCVQSLMAHASGDRTRRSPTPHYLGDQGESPATMNGVVSWRLAVKVPRSPNTTRKEHDPPHQECTCLLAARRTSSSPRGQGCP